MRALSAARSRNPAESAVALLAVLGITAVEVLATEMWIIVGSRARWLANVSCEGTCMHVDTFSFGEVKALFSCL